MQQFVSGPGAATGLVDDDGPPLSPETVGRAPSNFDPPVPLRPLAELIAEKALAAAKDRPADTVPAVADASRIVLRLLGGEVIELACYDDRDEALSAARELAELFRSAEETGDWPEVDGHFVRPGSVAVIDVVAAG